MQVGFYCTNWDVKDAFGLIIDKHHSAKVIYPHSTRVKKPIKLESVLKSELWF